jgi:two-component system, sensor histidine kinase SagS
VAAIAYLEHQAVDLVLMDLEMPELDGISATQQLRQSGQLELPIVALTTHVLPEHYQACTTAGMNDFLSKPIRFKDLQEGASKGCGSTFFWQLGGMEINHQSDY